MLKHSIKALTAGAALVLAAGGAWAQTGTDTSGSTVNPPSTNIGVDPQDAREATQKAVPRSDTGTLVRTEPSAADRAGDMAKDAKDAVTPDTRSSNTSNTSNTNTRNNPGTTANGTAGTAGSSMDTNMDNNSNLRNDRTNMRNNNRPARADRN